MNTLAHLRVRPWAWVCVFILVWSSSASAVVCTRYYLSDMGLPRLSSVELVWQQLADWVNTGSTTGYVVSGTSTSSTAVVCKDANCVSRSIASETGDYCVPDVCAVQSGTHPVINVTIGWNQRPSELPEDGGLVGDLTPLVNGSNVCNAGCGLNGVQAVQAYQSLEPAANGLYRWSADYQGSASGVSCTGAPSANQLPTTPPPSCPGYVGEVNGKRTCVAPVGSPLPGPSNPASAPIGVPVTAGNPAAGPMPATGPGAGGGGVGRTPMTGDGSNAGGSSSAAAGSLQGGTPGSGTAGDPYRPKDPCGLPGTPACKLDESGMPSSTGAFAGPLSAFDSAAASATAGITSAGSSAGSLAWSWGFSLPPGTCTSISATIHGRTFTVDPCSGDGIAKFRSALGYLVYMLGALYIWRSAVGSSKGGK